MLTLRWFTAAQAAQKWSKSTMSNDKMFTAAQAAQKFQSSSVADTMEFTAAQAAQKSTPPTLRLGQSTRHQAVQLPNAFHPQACEIDS